MNIVAMALNFRRRTLLGVSESEDHLLIGVLRNWISHLLLLCCSHFRSGHFEEIHLRKTWWGNSELALQIFIDFSILFSRVASYFNCLGWKPSGSIQLGWHWILEKNHVFWSITILNNYLKSRLFCVKIVMDSSICFVLGCFYKLLTNSYLSNGFYLVSKMTFQFPIFLLVTFWMGQLNALIHKLNAKIVIISFFPVAIPCILHSVRKSQKKSHSTFWV